MSSDPRLNWLIATSCDDRYLWPWACSVYSAVVHSNRPLRLQMINVNGLLSPSGQRIAKDLLSLLHVDGEITEMSLELNTDFRYQWNATVYARLGLLDVMEERFMWLDSDTILRSGWNEIFAEAERLMQDSNVIACGVLDCPTTLDELRQSGNNSAFQTSQGVYVNAGIFMADPVRWRRSGNNLLWKELVTKQSELGFIYGDQDVLNYLLAGKVGILPPQFNHIVSEAANGTEVILHYAGAPKPWKLTERGRAFYVAIEAINFDRPNDQISVGEAWRLFPTYWSAERALIAFLEERGNIELLNELLALRESQLAETPFQERAKFAVMRLLAKKLMPHRRG